MPTIPPGRIKAARDGDRVTRRYRLKLGAAAGVERTFRACRVAWSGLSVIHCRFWSGLSVILLQPLVEGEGTAEVA